MSNSAEDKVDDKQGWWQRLSGGLKRTSTSIGSAIADLVVKRLLDQAMLDEIEERAYPRRPRSRLRDEDRRRGRARPLRQSNLTR